MTHHISSQAFMLFSYCHLYFSDSANHISKNFTGTEIIPASLTHHSSPQALAENFTMGSFRVMNQDKKMIFDLPDFWDLKLNSKTK